MMRKAPWLVAATAALAAAPATVGVGYGKGSAAVRVSFDVRYDAAQVAKSAAGATFAGRASSVALHTAGAVVYDTYPAAGTRHARFTILFGDGTVSGTLKPSMGLPAGELDPTVVGASGRISRGTGRFRGLTGYATLSDQAGPGNAPAVSADGVHHQTFDICMATKSALRRYCGRPPTR